MTIYSVREHTSKRVNEELHSLQASCQRIAKRLAGKPGDAKLTALLERQVATLNDCIVAAHEGRTWRHRSHVDHMNAGKANAKVAGRFERATMAAIDRDCVPVLIKK